MKAIVAVVLAMLVSQDATPLCIAISEPVDWRLANAVFVGKVVSAKSFVFPMHGVRGAGGWHPRGFRSRIKVETAWKGIRKGQTVEVWSGSGEDGFSFAKGRRYLVFADLARDGRLHTSACEHTAPIEDAAALVDSVSAFALKNRSEL